MYSGIRKCRLPSANGVDEHVRRGGRAAVLRSNGLLQSQVVRQVLVRFINGILITSDRTNASTFLDTTHPQPGKSHCFVFDRLARSEQSDLVAVGDNVRGHPVSKSSEFDA